MSIYATLWRLQFPRRGEIVFGSWPNRAGLEIELRLHLEDGSVNEIEADQANGYRP